MSNGTTTSFGESPSIEPVSTDKNMVINTETTENRQKRVQAQHDFENDLESGGISLDSARQLLQTARERIFGIFPNVKGEHPVNMRHDYNVFKHILPRITQIIEGKLNLENFKINAIFPFINHNNVQDTTYNLCKIIDTIQIDDAEGLDPTEIALRAGAVFNTIGLLIHPYPDGNGQTFRAASLGIMQRLDPEHIKGKHFPIREAKRDDGSNIKLNVEPILSRKIPNLPQLPEIEAMNIINSISVITHLEHDNVDDYLNDPDQDESSKKRNLQRVFEWKENVISQLKENNLSIPEELEYEHDPLVFFNKYISFTDEKREALSDIGITENSLSIIANLNDKVSRIQEYFSVPEKIKAFFEQEIDNPVLEIFVDYLTNSNRGKAWLSNYISTGGKLDQEAIPQSLRWIENVSYLLLQDTSAQLEVMLFKNAG